MGMFDDVVGVPEIECCGVPLTNWQSKSGPCELEKIHWSRLTEFYAYCDTCHKCTRFSKNEFADGVDLTQPIIGASLGDYERYETRHPMYAAARQPNAEGE
jgi:hypothetical protein